MVSLIKMKQSGVSNTPQKILLYGGPDSGKTTAIGKLCKNFKKVYWFTMEKGHSSLLKLPDECLEPIIFIDIKDTSKEPNGITTIMKTFEKAVKICEAHGKIFESCPVCMKEKKEFIEVDLWSESTDTLVVIESLTQLAASGINHAVKNDGVDLANLKAEDKATFNHYGLQGRYLDNIFSNWQHLPCHGIMSSHEQNVSFDDKTEKLAPVGGTGNYSKKIGRSFDHTVRLYVKNGRHVGYSKTDNTKFVAGSRTGVDVMNPEGEVDLYRLFSLPNPEEEAAAPAKKAGGKMSFNKK